MLPRPKSCGCGVGGGVGERQTETETVTRQLQFIECYIKISLLIDEEPKPVIKESLFRDNFSDNARMKDGLQFLAIHMEGRGEKQVYKNHNF